MSAILASLQQFSFLKFHFKAPLQVHCVMFDNWNSNAPSLLAMLVNYVLISIHWGVSASCFSSGSAHYLVGLCSIILCLWKYSAVALLYLQEETVLPVRTMLEVLGLCMMLSRELLLLAITICQQIQRHFF